MEWWVNTGYELEVREQDEHDDGEISVFYHDVPPALAAEAVAKGRDQASTPMLEPWPLRTCRRGTCCVATTACSRPSSLAGSCGNAWASPPRKLTADTAQCLVARRNWQTVLEHTVPSYRIERTPADRAIPNQQHGRHGSTNCFVPWSFSTQPSSKKRP